MKTLLSLSFKMMYQAKKSTDMRRYRILMVMIGYTWTDPETGIEWYYTKSGTNATIKPNNKEQIVGNIVVPAQVAGYTVTGIAASAFDGCTEMTSIIIPEGIIYINSKAFQNCSKLKSFSTPSTLNASISNNLFDGCIALEKIDFTAQSTVAFSNNWLSSDPSTIPLKEIHLPPLIKTYRYPARLFKGLVNLRKVYMNQEVVIPQTIATTFDDIHDCTFYLPSETALNNFKKDQYWKVLDAENNDKGNKYEIFVDVHEYTPIISFSPSVLNVVFGDNFNIPEITILDDRGKEIDLPISYSSTEEQVASVNENNGIISINGVGTTIISANYAGEELIHSATGSYTLTVTKRPAGLAFSAKSYEAALGLTTDDLLPKLQNPHSLTVTYASSNTDIAEVAADGTVTLKAIGEADITATTEETATEEGGSASYHLTVNAPTSGLSVSAEAATLTYGASTEALPTFGNPNNLPLTYSSSDQTVATISNEGVVTLIGAGSTVISASFAGNSVLPNPEELSYTLTVNRRAGALAFEGDNEISLYMDTEPAASVFPVLQNPNNVAVTYTSSDESVVTVDAASGAVTRVGVGTATITATAEGEDRRCRPNAAHPRGPDPGDLYSI